MARQPFLESDQYIPPLVGRLSVSLHTIRSFLASALKYESTVTPNATEADNLIARFGVSPLFLSAPSLSVLQNRADHNEKNDEARPASHQ